MRHIFNRRSDRGQSLVEFALILPILLILLLGILDFGRAVAAYNAVSNGARSGARVAIVNQDFATIEAAVQSEAIGVSNIAVQFDPNVLPSQAATCPSIGCVIEVRVSHDFVPATPIIGNLVGSFTVSSASQMPIEFVNP